MLYMIVCDALNFFFFFLPMCCYSFCHFVLFQSLHTLLFFQVYNNFNCPVFELYFYELFEGYEINYFLQN